MVLGLIGLEAAAATATELSPTAGVVMGFAKDMSANVVVVFILAIVYSLF
jgi:hypothetical protein